MSWQTSLWLFQCIQALGISLWLCIAALNNVRAFSGSVNAVGATLSMVPLKLSPAIETPLLSRAVDSPLIHRLALLLVLGLQAFAAVTALIGSYALLIAGNLAMAQPWLNLALSAFAGFLFAMHLGGLWFGYWIRQEGLQLTHIALLIWVFLAFFLFNLPWG